MGVARDLVALEAKLRDRSDIDPFLPLELGGLLTDPATAAMMGRIAESGLHHDAATVTRLCLQCLRVQHAVTSPHLMQAEFVATVPVETPGMARPTVAVVREMIEGAQREVILVGYECSDEGTVDLLQQASGRGVAVVAICDRARGSARRIIDAWPRERRRPRVFHDRERADGTPYASMHAKCLLVDGEDLLITSANFTFHGLHGNIEIGTRLRGSAASEARKIFTHLVETRAVEEVE